MNVFFYSEVWEGSADQRWWWWCRWPGRDWDAVVFMLIENRGSRRVFGVGASSLRLTLRWGRISLLTMSWGQARREGGLKRPGSLLRVNMSLLKRIFYTRSVRRERPIEPDPPLKFSGPLLKNSWLTGLDEDHTYIGLLRVSHTRCPSKHMTAFWSWPESSFSFFEHQTSSSIRLRHRWSGWQW